MIRRKWRLVVQLTSSQFIINHWHNCVDFQILQSQLLQRNCNSINWKFRILFKLISPCFLHLRLLKSLSTGMSPTPFTMLNFLNLNLLFCHVVFLQNKSLVLLSRSLQYHSITTVMVETNTSMFFTCQCALGVLNSFPSSLLLVCDVTVILGRD